MQRRAIRKFLDHAHGHEVHEARADDAAAGEPGHVALLRAKNWTATGAVVGGTRVLIGQLPRPLVGLEPHLREDAIADAVLERDACNIADMSKRGPYGEWSRRRKLSGAKIFSGGVNPKQRNVARLVAPDHVRGKLGLPGAVPLGADVLHDL